MKVWANGIEEAAWKEKWCDRCFQPDQAMKRIRGTGDGCPLLIAAARNVAPPEWKRRRNAVMGDTYTCSQHLKRPKFYRKPPTVDETLNLFDEPEQVDVDYIPVEGWPSRPNMKPGVGRL